MSLPPNDVSARDLWLKLCETPAPSEVIDFPRKGSDGKPVGKLRIQVLSMGDHDEARLRAHAALKDRKLTPQDLDGVTVREVYADRVARELLAMACCTVDPIKGSDGVYGKVFPDAEKIGAKLTADEISVLFAAYLSIQSKYGPMESDIESPEELNAWIKRLAEGGSAVPLAQLPSQACQRLALSLAERAYSLSVILDGLCSSSPGIGASIPAEFAIGTGYFGAQPSSSIETGGATCPSEGAVSVAHEPLSLDDAVALARRMRGE